MSTIKIGKYSDNRIVRDNERIINRNVLIEKTIKAMKIDNRDVAIAINKVLDENNISFYNTMRDCHLNEVTVEMLLKNALSEKEYEIILTILKEKDEKCLYLYRVGDIHMKMLSVRVQLFEFLFNLNIVYSNYI